MKTTTVSTNGTVAFWSAKPCTREALRAALDAIGEGHLTPNARTDRSALETALREYAKAECPKGENHWSAP